MNRTRIISICNEKGGVGKTTTAINLAYGLANRGKKVLLIDFDPQANSTTGLGFYDTVSPNLYEVIKSDKDISDVIYETEFENLDLVPADKELKELIVKLNSKGIGREFALAKSMVRDGGSKLSTYDFIFIDNNPSLGVLAVNSMAVSDYVLIPLEASAFSAEGLNGLIEVIRDVQSINDKLKILGLVFLMVSKRENLEESFREGFQGIADSIFKTSIRRSVAVHRSQGAGEPLLEYDDTAIAAVDFEDFTNEFLERIENIEKEAEVV